MAPARVKLGLKDAATLASAAAGVASIGLSLKGSFAVAGALIVVAAFLDYSDGLIARRLKQANEFGKQLDSLADAVSFGAAPAALALGVQNDLPALAGAIVFVCAGIFRLARFNLQSEKGFYYGLPIPAAALVAVAAALFAPHAVAMALLALALLMVSGFKLKKMD